MATGKEGRAVDGKYTYHDKWERLCVCGRTLGVHGGEAPHSFDDRELDPREGLPDCPKFRLSRKKK